MKLSDYIRGFRKGKEAHRLEIEAMRDPFLADALEGYSRSALPNWKQKRKTRVSMQNMSRLPGRWLQSLKPG